MSIGNETVGDYLFKQQKIDIVGCWDKETPENEYEFYDLYDQQGNCLNEGDPFYEFPTWDDVKEYLTEVRPLEEEEEYDPDQDFGKYDGVCHQDLL